MNKNELAKYGLKASKKDFTDAVDVVWAEDIYEASEKLRPFPKKGSGIAYNVCLIGLIDSCLFTGIYLVDHIKQKENPNEDDFENLNEAEKLIKLGVLFCIELNNKPQENEVMDICDSMRTIAEIRRFRLNR